MLHQFDFDHMAKLAVEEPAEFARIRELLIRDAIDTAFRQDEAERIQAEIDRCRLDLPQCEWLGDPVGPPLPPS